MSAHTELFLGHAAMVDEDYETAVRHYSSAIELDPASADCYSKRAAAFLKRSRFTDASADASASVKIEPSAKAYQRKGVACFHLEEYDTARDAFSKALECEAAATGPASRELKRWLRKCDAELHLKASEGAATATGGASATSVAAPAASAASSSASAASADPSRIRHEWYQTQTHVVVSILARQVPKERASVTFDAASVEVVIGLEGGAEYRLGLSLFHKVLPAECKYSVSPSKVELTLKKHTAGKWESLEGTGSGELSQIAAVPDAQAPPSKSVYSGSKKDWDAIDSTLKKAEEEEKPEGEEALNKLFRDIYGKASDETRRAMNKSFQTSGGTVLSTNWEEVAQKDYEKDRTAPEGQEWKKWG